MQDWFSKYLISQQTALTKVDPGHVLLLARRLDLARHEDRQIFVFGNGGSAANCSHFATDLGKGASDAGRSKRFRILCLNDNVSWMTALANDYAYEDVFVGQLQNFAKPGDIAMSLSVSGNSPNCVKALTWARDHGLVTIALVGDKRGRMAEIADHVLVIEDTHYGRVEDAQMTVCHMICYAFMERAI